MGFVSRIGNKIKSGLRTGLKYGATALAVAGAGYLGHKANEERKLRSQAQQSNQLGEALSMMSPEQAQQFIEQQLGQQDLGANYGQLGVPAPPPAPVPIGQQGFGNNPNTTFGAKVSGIGSKISGVGGTIQSAEQGIAKIKNLFKG
tara:strand:- start:987 stop:1424 length:438 start_codon:yes stop_codon:yes gene_type:complete